MNKRTQKFVRILCFILAGLMILGVATTLLMIIFTGGI